MFKFFQKKPAVAEDVVLNNYINKDKYFVRIAPWDWLNKNEIFVSTVKDDKPTMLTMAFWLQEIFLDANGQITVTELVTIARGQYKKSKMAIPDDISAYLIDQLEHLINETKIVAFKDEKTRPEPHFDQPMSKQIKQ